MEIIGYKAFNANLENNYGKKFEPNKIYSVKGNVKFGIHGNGYHFCKRLEDTLRYVNGLKNNIVIAIVKGTGNICESFDDYNEYYDMYSASELEIIKILKRQEIFEIILEESEESIIRFIQGFKLTDLEIEFFEKKFYNNRRILNAIEYYQKNNTDIYNKKIT